MNKFNIHYTFIIAFTLIVLSALQGSASTPQPVWASTDISTDQATSSSPDEYGAQLIAEDNEIQFSQVIDADQFDAGLFSKEMTLSSIKILSFVARSSSGELKFNMMQISADKSEIYQTLEYRVADEAAEIFAYEIQPAPEEDIAFRLLLLVEAPALSSQASLELGEGTMTNKSPSGFVQDSEAEAGSESTEFLNIALAVAAVVIVIAVIAVPIRLKVSNKVKKTAKA